MYHASFLEGNNLGFLDRPQVFCNYNLKALPLAVLITSQENQVQDTAVRAEKYMDDD